MIFKGDRRVYRTAFSVTIIAFTLIFTPLASGASPLRACLLWLGVGNGEKMALDAVREGDKVFFIKIFNRLSMHEKSTVIFEIMRTKLVNDEILDFLILKSGIDWANFRFAEGYNLLELAKYYEVDVGKYLTSLGALKYEKVLAPEVEDIFADFSILPMGFEWDPFFFRYGNSGLKRILKEPTEPLVLTRYDRSTATIDVKHSEELFAVFRAIIWSFVNTQNVHKMGRQFRTEILHDFMAIDDFLRDPSLPPPLLGRGNVRYLSGGVLRYSQSSIKDQGVVRIFFMNDSVQLINAEVLGYSGFSGAKIVEPR